MCSGLRTSGVVLENSAGCSQAATGTSLYEAAVVNALRKVGLGLPRWSVREEMGQTKLPVC